MQEISAVILSAGYGKRFGGLKQIAMLNGKRLVDIAIDKALNSDFDEIILVKNNLFNVDQNDRFLILENNVDSFSLSLQTALRHISPNSSHSVIFLADMPFIREEYIAQAMHTAKENPNTWIVPVFRQVEYENRKMYGSPVVIPKCDFHKIENLIQDLTPRNIMLNSKRIELEATKNEIIDIDTLNDLQNPSIKDGDR